MFLYICIETQGKHMDDVVISAEMIENQIKPAKKWSEPGPDELHGFWLKHLKSLHQCIAAQFNHLFQLSTTKDWMTADSTFLIINDHQRGNKSCNYQSIKCLVTMLKLFTWVLMRSKCNYLIEDYSWAERELKKVKRHEKSVAYWYNNNKNNNK